MSITPAALREIRSLQSQAELILRSNPTRADGKRADLMISKMANIRQAGMSSDEQRQALANKMITEAGLPPITFTDESPEVRAHEELFKAFLSGAQDSEIQHRATSFLAGSATPIFTAGPQGGFLVPQRFASQVAEARAAVDNLLDPETVTLGQETCFQ